MRPGCEWTATSAPTRADRPRADPGDQLHPAAVEHDQRDQSRGQSDQGAAAEGEVERGRERDQRGGGEHPHQHVAARGEPERQDDADDGERPERVPVADRLVQAAVSATGRVHAEGAGVEPRRHAVTRRRRRWRRRRPRRPRRRGRGWQAAAARRRRRRTRGRGGCRGRSPAGRSTTATTRPSTGTARPGRRRRERGPRHAQVARRGQDHDHDGGVERRREAPRALEVAAVVGGEKPDGDGGEHERRGRRRTAPTRRPPRRARRPAARRALALVLIDRLRACQVRSSSWHTPSAR